MNQEYLTYQYIEDTKISSIDGIPKESFPDYFPNELISIDKVKPKNQKEAFFRSIQQFNQNWYSSYLYAAKEPILYNYYLGCDIYRFLWIRSFHLPIIITLSNKDGKIVLETKKLSKHPQVDNLIVDLEIDTRKGVSINDWLEFLTILNNASFWGTNPVDEDRGLDGSEWIIEGHTKDKYWFVYRWSPDKKELFRKCGKFLINLSGIKEKIY